MRKWLLFLSALLSLGLGCHRHAAPASPAPDAPAESSGAASQGGMQTSFPDSVSAGGVSSTVVRPPNGSISPNLPQTPLDSIKKQQLEGKYQVIPDTSQGNR